MSYLLFVDDDLAVLNIMKGLLSLTGHTVVATHDGNEAMELIDKEKFELVITDLVMPLVSGWEIARKVKNKAPHTPVILLTGWAEEYADVDLSQRGIDLLLSKPVLLVKLTTSIEKLLSGSREKPVTV